MPIQYSPKYVRDTEVFALWDELPDRVFTDIGSDRDALKELQKNLRGDVILPNSPSYQTERMIWNPIFNEYPRAIIQCKTTTDVGVALAFAQTLDQGGFQLRSGGHCTAGFSTGPGVLIDVKALNHCVISPNGDVANVGPGLMFGDFFDELDKRGLHVPGGECEGVCIAGFVQGGGYGFTSVSFGMSCDNIRSMQVMLWDGQIVTASAGVNPDLYWAMRGGTGGNFGVLLDAEFELRALGQCLGFAVTWPLTDATTIQSAADVMLLLQQHYMKGSAYEPHLNLQVSFCYQTEVDQHGQPIPHGRTLPYLMIRGLWTGDLTQGKAAIAPIQGAAGGIPQWIKTASFKTLNKELLSVPQGMPFLPDLKPGVIPFEDKTSRYIAKTLSQAEWISILNYFVTSPTNRAYGYLEFYGGTIAKPASPNAFVHRDALYNLTMDVYWMDVSERNDLETWLFGWKSLLAPFWNERIYQNYPNITAPDYDVNYWGPARFALSAIKQKYDPHNKFTFRQQVPQSYTAAEAEIDPDLQALIDAPITYQTTH